MAPGKMNSRVGGEMSVSSPGLLHGRRKRIQYPLDTIQSGPRTR